jgi:hypothetical protein
LQLFWLYSFSIYTNEQAHIDRTVDIDVLFGQMAQWGLPLLQKWPEDKREDWIKEVRKGMRDILVKDVGGPNELVFMEFEGIVGVGVKE